LSLLNLLEYVSGLALIEDFQSFCENHQLYHPLLLLSSVEFLLLVLQGFVDEFVDELEVLQVVAIFEYFLGKGVEGGVLLGQKLRLLRLDI